jgi:DNA-binding ferritin-like protein (Dps family)
MLSAVRSNVLKEFEEYYKTKHPKSQLDLNNVTRKVLREYLTFVEEILAPRYGLENIKPFYSKLPYPCIFICQKLPNTKILWLLTHLYSTHSIPWDLSKDFPNFASRLKETINKYKPIIETVTSNLLQDSTKEEWTDTKVWQHILFLTAKYLYFKKFTGLQFTYALEFLENALLEKKEHLTIPLYIYHDALSDILTQKLGTEVQFTEFGGYLTPLCQIRTSIDDFTLIYPDLPTEKNVTVTLAKIDEFNKTANEYLKKVYSRVKSTIKTFNTITKLLQ